VIEGLSAGVSGGKSFNSNINNPGSDKNVGMDWSQSLQATLFNTNNMNNDIVGGGESFVRFDSAEENMMVMDKVMGTLDQIVEQLDTMNQGLKRCAFRRRYFNIPTPVRELHHLLDL